METKLKMGKGGRLVLPAELREALHIQTGDVLVARLENDSCGGCFQNLTPNMINSLQLGHMVFCKSCGRLLYTPEDRSVGGSH